MVQLEDSNTFEKKNKLQLIREPIIFILPKAKQVKMHLYVGPKSDVFSQNTLLAILVILKAPASASRFL